MENRIQIVKKGITDIKADAIVNAANEGLRHGSGVCGAIFKAAGVLELTRACTAIGHCMTGDAVITPGFNTKAKYIIHAVGPIYRDGDNGEREHLHSAYTKSLNLAKSYMCKSIVFPLISAGIYGYPVKEAWEVALQACRLFLNENSQLDINIIFAIISDDIYDMGMEALEVLVRGSELDIKKNDDFVFFNKSNEVNGFLAQWFPCSFVVEGIQYETVQQYKAAKKALLFNDFESYVLIMHEKDPFKCKELGKRVKNFDREIWDSCCQEIVYHANYAKFSQNEELKVALLNTGNRMIVDSNPSDKIWGIGLEEDDSKAEHPKEWNGKNYLGAVLEQVRKQLLMESNNK